MKNATRNEMAEALADLSIGLGAKEDKVPEGWRSIAEWHQEFAREDPNPPAQSTLAKRIRELVRTGQWEMKTFRVQSVSKLARVPHYRKKR